MLARMTQRTISPLPETGFRTHMAGAVLVLLLALAWGCNWPAMKLALRDIDVWLFRCGTALGGGLIFLTALKLRGLSLGVPRQQWPALAFCAFFNITVFPLSSTLALLYLPAGWTAILAYTMPVWASILGLAVLDERLTWRRLVALVMGLAGVGVLMAPDLNLDGASRDLMLGFAIILAGAVLWAVGVVGQKRVRWSRPTSVIAAWQVFVGGLPYLLLVPVLADLSSLAEARVDALLAWAYAVLIGLALGTYLFYRIVARFPVATAGVASLSVPVVGVLSASLLLGEALGLRELGSLVLVVSAVALVLLEPPEVRPA